MDKAKEKIPKECRIGDTFFTSFATVWLCEPSLLSVWDRLLPIISSSIQTDVYTILGFSEISLPRAYLLSGFIVLTSPYERSADPIPRIFEVTL